MTEFGRYFREVPGGAVAPGRPQYLQVLFRNGDCPDPVDSHGNVRRWCSEHPGASAIHGWMAETTLDGRTLFSTHALICNSHGHVYDITRVRPGPFVEHAGDPYLYEIVPAAHTQVVWPPPVGDSGGFRG